MLTEKTELLIKSICLIVLILLAIAIYYNGKDLSCDKCTINFESQKNVDPLDLTKQSFNVSIIDLYESYSKDICLIKFSKTDGYYKNVIPDK